MRFDDLSDRFCDAAKFSKRFGALGLRVNLRQEIVDRDDGCIFGVLRKIHCQELRRLFPRRIQEGLPATPRTMEFLQLGSTWAVGHEQLGQLEGSVEG